jgi:hypothetical protein
MRMKYLWIYALWIVQNFENIARNLSVMHSTYRNSLLTIVAARASSAEHGFLGSPVEKDADRATLLSEIPGKMHTKIPMRRADGA